MKNCTFKTYLIWKFRFFNKQDDSAIPRRFPFARWCFPAKSNFENRRKTAVRRFHNYRNGSSESCVSQQIEYCLIRVRALRFDGKKIVYVRCIFGEGVRGGGWKKTKMWNRVCLSVSAVSDFLLFIAIGFYNNWVFHFKYFEF